MKKFIVCFIMILPILLTGQRIEIPKDNPGNHLDLKLVYQNYTVKTQNNYGHTISSRKDSLLLLKVNGAYFSSKETGVSKPVFNKYLSECPEALKISNSGFNLYKKNRQFTHLSNALNIVGVVGTIYYGYSYLKSKKNSYLYPTIGFGIVFGSSYFFQKYANSQYHKADKKMLNAIEIYNLNCYVPPDNLPINANSTENGQNNKNEKILLEYHKNDARALLFSVGLSSGITSYSDYKFGAGANALISKNGFQLYGDIFSNKFSTDFYEKDGLEWKLTGSIPILRSIRERKLKVDAGKFLGISFIGDFEGISLLSSLNIDGGIQNISANIESDGSKNGFHYKSKIKRAGLSYNTFYFIKYRLNDNRFSPKMRYNLVNLRLYAHALLDIKTEYYITDPTFFNVNPEFNKYGGVLGLDIIYSKLPIGSFKFNLEGGQYNYTRDDFRFDFKALLGFSLYFVH